MNELVMKRRNNRQARKRGRGQSFMEFALTLPILLLVTMGIFDFGRALFTYAEASNALRTALRYGAILGFAPNGQPQYTDCRGMIDIARHISFDSPATLITVTYIEDINRDGYSSVSVDDADVQDGTVLKCTFQNGNYNIADWQDIRDGTKNGAIILITIDAQVSMVTPVFPRFMPISIQGIRSLVKDIQLAKCGDGIWAPTETCWNCVEDMGNPPSGADPGICLLAAPDIVGPPYDNIVLTWNNVVDYNALGHEEDRYDIQYLRSTDAAWATRMTTGAVWLSVGSGTTAAGGGANDESADIVTATLSGLTCNATTEYQFRVRAVDTSGTAPQTAAWNYSDEVKLSCSGADNYGGSIRTDGPSVTRPSPLVASSTGPASIVLTFQDNSNDEEEFCVYRMQAPADPTVETNWPPRAGPAGSGQLRVCYDTDDGGGMAGVETYTDTAVTCGTTYYYRVVAHSTEGGGDWSNYTNYVTQAPSCLSAPTISFYTPSSLSLRGLEASDVTNAERYYFERSEDGVNFTAFPNGTTYVDDLTVNPHRLDDSAAMSCIVPNNSSHTYWYRVRAWTSGTNGPYSIYSNVISYVYPGTCTPPSAPTSLQAVWLTTDDATSSATIGLRWNDTASTEDNFVIEWSTSPTFVSSTQLTIGAFAGTGTYPSISTWHTTSLSGFGAGTYYFRVKARGDAATEGDSAYTSSATVTILPPPSFTVSPNSCGNGSNSGNPVLSWTTVAGVSHYLLEAKTTIDTWPSWNSISRWLLANVTSCQGDAGTRCNLHAASPAPTSLSGTRDLRLRSCTNNVANPLPTGICSWPSPAIQNTCN